MILTKSNKYKLTIILLLCLFFIIVRSCRKNTRILPTQDQQNIDHKRDGTLINVPSISKKVIYTIVDSVNKTKPSTQHKINKRKVDEIIQLTNKNKGTVILTKDSNNSSTYFSSDSLIVFHLTSDYILDYTINNSIILIKNSDSMSVFSSNLTSEVKLNSYNSIETKVLYKKNRRNKRIFFIAGVLTGGFIVYKVVK